MINNCIDKITCEICNKPFKRITMTHLKHHGMNNVDEYKQLFPNAPIVSKELAKQYATNSEERFIKKYGEDLGKIKYSEYKKFQSVKNTFEYKRQTYGWSREQFDEYNRSRSVTKENLIKRHGEIIGTQKWNKYVNRQKYAG